MKKLNFENDSRLFFSPVGLHLFFQVFQSFIIFSRVKKVFCFLSRVLQSSHCYLLKSKNTWLFTLILSLKRDIILLIESCRCGNWVIKLFGFEALIHRKVRNAAIKKARHNFHCPEGNLFHYIHFTRYALEMEQNCSVTKLRFECFCAA